MTTAQLHTAPLAADRAGRFANEPPLPEAVMAGPEHGQHLVGPNAIIQTGHALLAHLGEPLTRSIYNEAGIADLLDDPPKGMIGAVLVRQLCRAIEARVDADTSKPIWEDAGCRTGHYILENRIPAVARLILRSLPPALSSRLLLKAIVNNSWTFAGQAVVSGRTGCPARLEIIDNPLPLPGRIWHRAVFTTLFSALVCRKTRVDWFESEDSSLNRQTDTFLIRCC